MVLGLRSKTKRPSSVQLDYTIHIHEIRPWPPSQSLKSLRSVALQWENGDRSSGHTAAVVPGQSKIEFDESFKLQTTLIRDGSARSNAYKKNVLELSLYEPRRDRAAKGQILGTAAVDLGEHGIAREAMSFGLPLNCRRSYRNTAQPVVYVTIRVFDKAKEESLDRESTQSRESVSALMIEEYAEEEEAAEIASFTDDDVSSSHSSLASSAFVLEASADPASRRSSRGEQVNRENGSEEAKEVKAAKNVELIPFEPVSAETVAELEEAVHILHGTLLAETVAEPEEAEHILHGSLSAETVAEPEEAGHILNGTDICNNSCLQQSPPVELSADADTMDVSLSPQTVTGLSLKKSDSHTTDDLPSVAYEVAKEGVERNVLHEDKEKMESCRHKDIVAEGPQSNAQIEQYMETPKLVSIGEPDQKSNNKKSEGSRDGSDNLASRHYALDNCTEENVEAMHEENISDKRSADAQGRSTEIDSADSSHDNGTIASNESLERIPVIQQPKYLQVDPEKDRNSDLTMPSQRVLGKKVNRTLTGDRLNHMQFSLRSPPQPLGSIRYAGSDQYNEDVKEVDFMEDVSDGGKKSILRGRISATDSTKSSSDKVKNVTRSKRNNFPNDKVKELELRVEMLEEELRQAAAIEIGLYSIVAEHGSSFHKVHTPARRLSRIYIHASVKGSPERKGSTARSIVSGLISAAKACGNDVPRLAFWLSNSVVLRGIVSQVIGNASLQNSSNPHSAINGSKGKFSLKWESSSRKKEHIPSSEELDDLEDLCQFTAVLERIEAWMFSRIIESIWWQTLTPHMQSTNEAGDPKTGSPMKEKFGKQSSSGDQQKANLPIENWKKAFDDACGRLCPVRAEGHECGCLPMLSRLVMEQCVARLDVAMFNAILRESDDDIPTDPVSDPISDPNVLPVPPGKLSFGAGAQLKNAVGNWSRWLTDLFGMDADDSPRDKNELDDNRLDLAESKSFFLLNAMSDLLMLPKDMLLEKSIRKEVCPTFTGSMIKRILTSFSPDEFCPDPIPAEVLEALDSEDPLESDEAAIKDFPCNASPVVYHAPSADLIENIIGNVRRTSLGRSGSSLIRKCHTSDDELDELDSPLSSILTDQKSTPSTNAKRNTSTHAVRYQLLRDVWRCED